MRDSKFYSRLPCTKDQQYFLFHSFEVTLAQHDETESFTFSCKKIAKGLAKMRVWLSSSTLVDSIYISHHTCRDKCL